MSIVTKTKNNGNKSGAAKARKEQRRKEAEERNAAYQSLPIDQKILRHSTGGKVHTKLKSQLEDVQVGSDEIACTGNVEVAL